MSRIFDRLTDTRFDNAVVDWLVLATGIVVLTASVAAGVTASEHGRVSGNAAGFGQQTEVTPS